MVVWMRFPRPKLKQLRLLRDAGSQRPKEFTTELT